MFWNTNKRNKQAAKDAEASKWGQHIDDVFNMLKEHFPLGSKFNYLGAEVLVTHHYLYDPSAVLTGSCPYDPKLIGDYRDNNGVIRSLTLSPFEAYRLISTP